MDRHDLRRFRLDYYPHAVEIASRYADVDDLGHINNLALAAVYEDGRTRFYMDYGVWTAPQARDAIGAEGVIMVASLKIDFIAETHYPAPIVIHNAVVRVGEKSFSTHQLATQDDKPVSLCDATFAYVAGKAAVRLPDPIRARLLRAMTSQNGESA